MLQYYVILRSVLKDKPHLRRCQKRCRHCGIFFLTYPCNAGRNDLRCPFGCRDAHRKKCSNQRSAAYYQDEQGRKIKSALNQRRGAGNKQEQKCIQDTSILDEEYSEWKPQLVEHIRVVTSMIEGRCVSLDEIVAMLTKKMRQPSLDWRRKIDYIVWRLNNNPP